LNVYLTKKSNLIQNDLTYFSTCYLKLTGPLFISAFIKGFEKQEVIFINFLGALFCQYHFAKKLPSRIIIGEKMRNSLLYKKLSSKMLMKLTQARHLYFTFVCCIKVNLIKLSGGVSDETA